MVLQGRVSKGGMNLCPSRRTSSPQDSTPHLSGAMLQAQPRKFWSNIHIDILAREQPQEAGQVQTKRKLLTGAHQQANPNPWGRHDEQLR